MSYMRITIGHTNMHTNQQILHKLLLFSTRSGIQSEQSQAHFPLKRLIRNIAHLDSATTQLYLAGADRRTRGRIARNRCTLYEEQRKNISGGQE